MMKIVVLAAGLALLFGASAIAQAPSADAAAAVADKDRPSGDTARDADRKPAEMLAFAGIKPGDVAVDLIPGGGYFTRLFANAVGPAGHVYVLIPTEIDDTMAKLNPSLPKDNSVDPKWPNVTLLHRPIHTLTLPQKADLIWISQNYHDLHDKFMGPVDTAQFNASVYNALKPGGAFIVLDHAAPGTGLSATETLHRIDPVVVKREVEAAGFKFVGEDDALANPADDHTKNVFDKSIRGKTDQFVYKFQKPL